MNSHPCPWWLVVYWAVCFLAACVAGYIESYRLNKLDRMLRSSIKTQPKIAFFFNKYEGLGVYGTGRDEPTLREFIDSYDEKLLD